LSDEVKKPADHENGSDQDGPHGCLDV
jgi:hypothetical protein